MNITGRSKESFIWFSKLEILYSLEPFFFKQNKTKQKLETENFPYVELITYFILKGEEKVALFK